MSESLETTMVTMITPTIADENSIILQTTCSDAIITIFLQAETHAGLLFSRHDSRFRTLNSIHRNKPNHDDARAMIRRNYTDPDTMNHVRDITGLSMKLNSPFRACPQPN